MYHRANLKKMLRAESSKWTWVVPDWFISFWFSCWWYGNSIFVLRLQICQFRGLDPTYVLDMSEPTDPVGGLEHEFYFSIHLGMSSSQLLLTSYIKEGVHRSTNVNHQADLVAYWLWLWMVMVPGIPRERCPYTVFGRHISTRCPRFVDFCPFVLNVSWCIYP